MKTHVVRYKKSAFRVKTIDIYFFADYNTLALIAQQKDEVLLCAYKQKSELSGPIIPPYDGRWIRMGLSH